jgi:transcriptional regulator with XRE-family HTH domain
VPSGRKIKPLPIDGSPRTEFARRLRALWEEAGSPPYKELAGRVGWDSPRLSELFNATKVPAPDLLRDVVIGLGCDPEPWLKRLDALVRTEAAAREEALLALQPADADQGHAQAMRELRRLRKLSQDPRSVISSAAEAVAAADRRALHAQHLESSCPHPVIMTGSRVA